MLVALLDDDERVCCAGLMALAASGGSPSAGDGSPFFDHGPTSSGCSHAHHAHRGGLDVSSLDASSIFDGGVVGGEPASGGGPRIGARAVVMARKKIRLVPADESNPAFPVHVSPTIGGAGAGSLEAMGAHPSSAMPSEQLGRYVEH